MKDYAIRQADARDVEPLADCIDAAFAVYKSRISDLPSVSEGIAAAVEHKRVWVADSATGIVGGVILAPHDDFMILENVSVSPNCSGMGIGSALIQQAEKDCRELGLTTLRLSTHIDMPENIRLYKRLGWQETQRSGSKVHMSKTIVGDELESVNIAAFQTEQSHAIIALFTRVFATSEGEAEGKTIGCLVSELIDTTDTNDLYGFSGSLNSRIVGCIFFSRLKLAASKSAFLLSPVAVDSQYQGRGIGQQLINHGLQKLRSDGVEWVFTYGDPNFYKKMGFFHMSEDIVKAPQKLTYPEGWLAQTLTNMDLAPEQGVVECVDALNKQEYW